MKKLIVPFILGICAFFVLTPQTIANATEVCVHPTLGEQYCEATHPHEYYRQCKSCGEKVYTGGTATKNHGTGEWGSGTCPSCGTHTFVWSDCTSPGTCVCGATTTARGHYVTGNLIYEAVHPHRYFKRCQYCNTGVYTGATKTLTHGDGTNGTCPSCGMHTFLPGSTPTISEHPHATTASCACGQRKTTYPVNFSCTQCRANSTVGSRSNSIPVSMKYYDGDQNIYLPIYANFTLTITYTNTYNSPASNDVMQLYDFPEFASFGSSVTLTAGGAAPGTPPIYTYAKQNVYYNFTGGSTRVQSLTPVMPNVDTLNMAGGFITDSRFPTNAIADGTCNLDGTTQTAAISVVLYFSK